MKPAEQYNRIIAEVNMTDAVHANCEECGAKIPVECSLCTECAYLEQFADDDIDDGYYPSQEDL